VRGVTPASDCRILRGSKAQKPKRMCIAANLFVGLHIRKRQVGNGRGQIERFVGMRIGSRSGRDSEPGPSEREKLPRVNPRSGRPSNRA